MGYSKMSVTIPDKIYREIKELSSSRGTKVSHLVAEALSEKIRKMKEDEFLERVNEVFDDPEAAREQDLMAKTIAETTELEEIPW